MVADASPLNDWVPLLERLRHEYIDVTGGKRSCDNDGDDGAVAWDDAVDAKIQTLIQWLSRELPSDSADLSGQRTVIFCNVGF
jgi:hypothetical protein